MKDYNKDFLHKGYYTWRNSHYTHLIFSIIGFCFLIYTFILEANEIDIYDSYEHVTLKGVIIWTICFCYCTFGVLYHFSSTYERVIIDDKNLTIIGYGETLTIPIEDVNSKSFKITDNLKEYKSVFHYSWDHFPRRGQTYKPTFPNVKFSSNGKFGSKNDVKDLSGLCWNLTKFAVAINHFTGHRTISIEKVSAMIHRALLYRFLSIFIWLGMFLIPIIICIAIWLI